MTRARPRRTGPGPESAWTFQTNVWTTRSSASSSAWGRPRPRVDGPLHLSVLALQFRPVRTWAGPCGDLPES